MKIKILFVEDDPTILELERTVFEKLGYNVLSTTTAEEALDIATSEKPDAIAIDVMLPDGDGYFLARQLKARKDTKAIPLAFVTAKDTPAAVLEGFECGGRVHLTKPFTINGLKTAIQSITGLNQDAAHSKI